MLNAYAASLALPELEAIEPTATIDVLKPAGDGGCKALRLNLPRELRGPELLQLGQLDATLSETHNEVRVKRSGVGLVITVQ